VLYLTPLRDTTSRHTHTHTHAHTHTHTHTHTHSSIGLAPAVVNCARHFYDHNYDITFALEHILQDRHNFKESLGHKKRWPLALVLGVMIDFDLYKPGWDCWECQSAEWAYKQTRAVGMEPFNPPDVAGFDLDSIWISTHITAAHEFLLEQIKPRAKWETADADFLDLASMQAALAPYYLGPSQPNKYAWSARLCGPDFYIDESGAEGKHMIDSDSLFGNASEVSGAGGWMVGGFSIDPWLVNWLGGNLETSDGIQIMQLRAECRDDATRTSCEQGEGYKLSVRGRNWNIGLQDNWEYFDYTGPLPAEIEVTYDEATKIFSIGWQGAVHHTFEACCKNTGVKVRWTDSEIVAVTSDVAAFRRRKVWIEAQERAASNLCLFVC
jgi:hypothetical protein